MDAHIDGDVTRAKTPRRFLRLLAVLVTGLLMSTPEAVAATTDASLHEVAETQLRQAGAPGVAWAAVDGTQVCTGARGVTDSRGSTLVTANTPFVTGSISKSVTALAVMQLVERGMVNLDGRIDDHLDVFSGQPAGEITVRELLSHTSGFSTLQGNDAHTNRTGAPDELALSVQRLALTPPAGPPGQRWEYSNANYEILGRLVEVVSDRDFATYVRVHILEPIGMRHSFVSDGQAHAEMATGHRPWFGTARPVSDNRTHRGSAPQGGLVASAADLGRYLRVMMNERDDVLSAAGKATMRQPANAASPFYGFGWFVDPDSGRVWHSGDSPGFETLATMLPEQKRAAVVLVNAGSGIGFGETADLRGALTAQALGQDYAGEGGRWAQKALFVGLTLAPVAFLLSTAWAWRHRAALRAKTGLAGRFSPDPPSGGGYSGASW